MKKEVDQKFINQIIETAQKVPSWCNSQPWQVILLRRETRELLSEKLVGSADQGYETPDIDFPKRYAGVYKHVDPLVDGNCIMRLASKGVIERVQVSKWRKITNFWCAPIAIITTPKDLGAYGVLDCGAFITAFTLAAAAIEFHQYHKLQLLAVPRLSVKF